MQTVIRFSSNNDIRLYILLACRLMYASVHVVIDSTSSPSLKSELPPSTAPQYTHRKQSPTLLKFTIPDEPTNLLHTCVFRQLYFLFIPLLRRTSSTLWFRYRYRFVYVGHFISLNIHKFITKLIGHIYSWVLFLLQRRT